MKNIIIFALAILSIFFIVRTSELKNELKATNEQLENMERELAKHSCKQEDTLSEWDLFTLALMKVESNYDISAVSSVGAKGYFQIMPIYVAEVNRVHNTNYKYEDVVKSFEKSYEVFTLMQEAHNENFSMDKALTLHNGNHKWYHKRVYNEMETIEKYEKMRRMVKNANPSII